MNILVIRFRQLGDAVLATPLLNSLRLTYPDARIDFVLNDRIAPLFEHHPALSNIIPFTEKERHNLPTYLRKVWRCVRRTRYDVIIDMRSTVNTMPFVLFSPSTSFRIGIDKPYSRPFLTHRVDGCRDDESMIDHNLRLLQPLATATNLQIDRRLSLHVSEQEKTDFRHYMQRHGIEFARPVMLAGVTAKLEEKTWKKERMTEVLRRLLETYPHLQIVFNYAPNEEERKARAIYDQLGHPENVFFDIQARGVRALAAMAANVTFYFGNEGGTRHIVQAVRRPSLVICSPSASKTTWLPTDDQVPTKGIAASDVVRPEQLLRMDDAQRYEAITTDLVWDELLSFCQQLAI